MQVPSPQKLALSPRPKEQLALPVWPQDPGQLFSPDSSSRYRPNATTQAQKIYIELNKPELNQQLHAQNNSARGLSVKEGSPTDKCASNLNVTGPTEHVPLQLIAFEPDLFSGNGPGELSKATLSRSSRDHDARGPLRKPVSLKAQKSSLTNTAKKSRLGDGK